MMAVSNGQDRIAGRLRTLSLVTLGLGLGYLAGTASAPSTSAFADVTEEPRREALKAGSVINEAVLREIAATLKRIETRVEGIETNIVAKAPAPARKDSKIPEVPRKKGL